MTPSAPTVARPATYSGTRPAADTTRVAFPPQFHILRRLGVGGMAEVFAALYRAPNGRERPVVIKRPLPDLAAHPEFLTMFLDEAKIASSLHHPNIVRVYDIVHQPDTCLLVMELVDGKSVSSLLGRLERSGQRLESRLAAHVVARAAEGLHYAHTRIDAAGNPLRIVHRDVSPQNVLISFAGEVKVIDFGIAHALGRVTQTRTGTRKGKTGYMAPEQARAGAIDCRVDVFALGILLWELSCGRRLFVRPDDFRSMNALLVDPIPLPSTVAAVPPQLEAITMRALARDPNERYQTAEELRSDLDAFTVSVGGAAPAELGALVKVLFATDTPLLRQEPTTGADNIPPVVTTSTTPLRKRRYDRRQMVMLASGAVLAAGLGGLISWAGRRFGTQFVRRAAASASGKTETPVAVTDTLSNDPAIFSPPLKHNRSGQAPGAPAWPPAAPPAPAPQPAPAPAPALGSTSDASDPTARGLRPGTRGSTIARRARSLRAKTNPF